MVSTGGDPSLRERIARGEYVVDPQAVAEAMLCASARLGRARRNALLGARSPMLVPAEALERLAVLRDDDEPLPGPDVA
jgi:Anti-sigma-28 factor, FlgM